MVMAQASPQKQIRRAMTSICFLSPQYGGKCDTPFFGSCIKAQQAFDDQGIEVEWALGTNESLVHRGRMSMLASAMDETDHDIFWFLDSDIQSEPDDFARIWNLITDPDKSGIAVGVYPMKKHDACWYAAWVDGKLIKDLDKYSEPIKVDYAGTGFMAITRKALETVRGYLQERESIAKQLIERLGEDLTPIQRKVAKEMQDCMSWYWDGPERETPAFFMTPIVEQGGKRILESEDYNFCRIARDAGLDIWMDPACKLIHWGSWAYGLHR